MADLVITAANVALVSGSPRVATAGVAVTAGQALYPDANGVAQLAQSDTATHSQCMGIALCNAAAGQPVAYAIAGSEVTVGATVVQGGCYVVSATAGKIAPEADLGAGAWVTQIGRATTTGRLRLDLTAYSIQHG